MLLPCTCASILALAVLGRASDVPAGLSEGDWSRIRAAWEDGRYGAFAVDAGHEARNPGQRWRTRFDGRGFLTEPDAGGWTWGLALERYGFAGDEREVTRPARVSAEGSRVTYTWDATLEEWYANDARGLEHGFTVRRRPARDDPAGVRPLTFTLAVRGALRAEVEAGGRSVRFLDEGGAVVLTYSGLSVQDADGRELEAGFVALGDAGEGLVLAVDESGARYPLTVDPIAQQAYLKASNTDGGEYFGLSVAVSGDTVLVGAFREASNATGVNGNQLDNSAQDAGAAYVFVRSGTSWSQQAYLKASNTEMQDYFGYSVALSGDTAVVGARWEDSSATGVNGNQSDNSTFRAGAAYVFVRNGTTWSQEAYLKASNPDVYDEFGRAVAVSGDTLVVGAYAEDSNATGVNGNESDNSLPWAGAAYVFVRSGTSWAQQAYLKASNPDSLDEFGYSVAVSGDTVVVGAEKEASNATGVNGNQLDNSAPEAGAAYVFQRTGTSWSHTAYLKGSNTGAYDEFGDSVAVWGDTMAIGARRESSNATGVNGNENDNSANSAGAAYVFVRGGTSWSQEAYLKASNTNGGDQFGGSVAGYGDTMVVGAWAEDGSDTGVNGNQGNGTFRSGAAYSFVRNGTTWSQGAYLKASNTGVEDWFGFAVGVSGDNVVVGAPREASGATGVNGAQNNNNAHEAGAVYVFRLPLGTPYCTAGPTSLGVPAEICASGSTSVAANDLLLRAEPVPDQPGVFFYGPFQTNQPFGNGTLCVAGQVARLGVVDASGFVLAYLVDNTSPPSAATQITSGSTWNFQAWFRDPAAGGSLFDLSNGLTVTFEP